MAREKALTEAGEGLGIKEKDTWVGMGAGMWFKIRLSGWQGPGMQARELSSLGRRVRGERCGVTTGGCQRRSAQLCALCKRTRAGQQMALQQDQGRCCVNPVKTLEYD